MSHQPPIPPGNQSPFPIAELPHAHPAPLPPVVERGASPSSLLTIGAAIAAIGLAASGVAAVMFSRARPKRKRKA